MHQTTLLCVILFLLTLFIHSYIGFTRLSFLQDSARDVLIAKQHLQAGNLIVEYGPKASVGNFFLPPLYYQIHVLLTGLFPKQPLVMMILILVVESFTPVLVFLFLKNLITRNAALAIAASYSVFALVISFSTQAWNPNMIPFCTMLTIFAWYQVTVTAKIRWLYAGTIAPLVAISLHFQAVVLAPFVLSAMLYVWFLRKQLRLHLLFATLMALLIFLPYLVGELHNNWVNTRAIQAFFLNEHSRYFDRVSKPAYLMSYLPSFIERVTMGRELYLLILGRFIFWFGMLALAIASRNKKVARWILVYIISVIISLRVFKGDKLDYYLLILFPAIPMLVAGIISLCKEKLQLILSSSLLIIVLLSGMNMGAMQPRNSLIDLQNSIEFIEKYSQNGKVRLVFHNLIYANLLVFGLEEYSDVEHDVNGTILIDVCGIGDSWCVWKIENRSSEKTAINSSLYHYLENIHGRSGYTFIDQKNFGSLFTMVAGSIASPSGSFHHPLIENEDRTGTDYLITTY